jgi:hypothetical protein
MEQNLRRHLSSQHKEQADVFAILTGSLTDLESRRAFAIIRNKGIVQKNKELSALNDDPVYETIKKGSTSQKMVHCSVCDGPYPKKYFGRHRMTCKKATTSMSNPMPVRISLMERNERADYLDILGRFQDNDVGNICRSDDTIKLVGRHLWQKDCTKVDKHDEVRKSVMADMRNLANLYLHFQSSLEGQESRDASDMFKREHWKALQEAIISITSKETGSSGSQIKYGLKNTIYYLLVKAVEILQGDALADQGKEKQVEELRNF